MKRMSTSLERLRRSGDQTTRDCMHSSRSTTPTDYLIAGTAVSTFSADREKV